MKERLAKLMGFFCYPFVVVWFWFARWVAHNKLVFRLKPGGATPNILSYPFIAIYYFLKLLSNAWRYQFADYGVRKYSKFIKKHYSGDGWGKIKIKNSEQRTNLFNNLHSRFAYYLDHASLLISCKDGDTFLDAACGFGENLKELRRRFPNSKIHAFDISPNAIEFIHMSDFGNATSAEEGSILDFNYLSKFKDASYDWVLYSHAFSFIFASSLKETTELRKKVLQHLSRIARKGFIMLETFPSDETKFVLEQNTRSALKTDITSYFEGIKGELFLAHHIGQDAAYLLMKKEMSVQS
jgi:SAM-dependent methyltransferase